MSARQWLTLFKTKNTTLLFEHRVVHISRVNHTCVSVGCAKYSRDLFLYQFHYLAQNILTSFLSASRMSVFSSFKQLLMRARRFFSMIGLLFCRQTDTHVQTQLVTPTVDRTRTRPPPHTYLPQFGFAETQRIRLTVVGTHVAHEVIVGIFVVVAIMHDHSVNLRFFHKLPCDERVTVSIVKSLSVCVWARECVCVCVCWSGNPLLVELL